MWTYSDDAWLDGFLTGYDSPKGPGGCLFTILLIAILILILYYT